MTAYDFHRCKGYPVTLSESGQDHLEPRVPLVGIVAGTENGLVAVREPGNTVSLYHPDFLALDLERKRAR